MNKANYKSNKIVPKTRYEKVMDRTLIKARNLKHTFQNAIRQIPPKKPLAKTELMNESKQKVFGKLNATVNAGKKTDAMRQIQDRPLPPVSRQVRKQLPKKLNADQKANIRSIAATIDDTDLQRRLANLRRADSGSLGSLDEFQIRVPGGNKSLPTLPGVNKPLPAVNLSGLPAPIRPRAASYIPGANKPLPAIPGPAGGVPTPFLQAGFTGARRESVASLVDEVVGSTKPLPAIPSMDVIPTPMAEATSVSTLNRSESSVIAPSSSVPRRQTRANAVRRTRPSSSSLIQGPAPERRARIQKGRRGRGSNTGALLGGLFALDTVGEIAGQAQRNTEDRRALNAQVQLAETQRDMQLLDYYSSLMQDPNLSQQDRQRYAQLAEGIRSKYK